MRQIGEGSTVRCGYQDKFYNQRYQKKKFCVNIFFRINSKCKDYEPSSKPKDDVCRVSGFTFAINYMSFGFEVPGVRILRFIVQHSPIRQSVIKPCKRTLKYHKLPDISNKYGFSWNEISIVKSILVYDMGNSSYTSSSTSR